MIPACLLLHISTARVAALPLHPSSFASVLTRLKEACLAALRKSIDSKASLSCVSTKKHISKAISATRALQSPPVAPCHLPSPPVTSRRGRATHV